MAITMSLVELIYDKEEHKKRIKDGMGYPYGNIETIFKVNGKLLGGAVWTEEYNVEGDVCDLYGFFQDILIGLAFLLDEGKSTREPYYRKDVEHSIMWHGFEVKNLDLAYSTSLHFMYNDYVFELDKDKMS